MEITNKNLRWKTFWGFIIIFGFYASVAEAKSKTSNTDPSNKTSIPATTEEPITSDSGCGNSKHLRTAPGNLTSHPLYGKGGFIPDHLCEWFIVPPKDKYVALRITEFGNLLCARSLFIWTNVGESGWPGWNPCAEEVSANVFLDSKPDKRGEVFTFGAETGKVVRLWYKGNEDPKNRTGFMLSYDFKEPACRGSQKLFGHPTWFASHPGAGRWAAEANLDCQWTITAPEGQFITLEAEFIWIHCVTKWQTMTIFDGDTEEDNLILAKLYCTHRLGPIASSGNHLRVHYRDVWAAAGMGFNISYKFHPQRQSGCGTDMLLAGIKGTIQSHPNATGDRSSLYFPWSRCRWTLETVPGAILLFQFDWFDVHSPTDKDICGSDRLVISPGTQNDTVILCNSNRPFTNTLTVVPATPRVNVTFTTGRITFNNKQGSGFRVHYSVACRVPGSTHLITMGESASFNCSQGQVYVRGDAHRLCQPNGMLSGDDYLCRVVECGLPERVANAARVVDHTQYRGIITYICKQGYRHVSGSMTRVCQENGLWTGTNPVCEAVDCGKPEHIPHTVRNFQGTHYGQVAVYTCVPHYHLVSGNPFRTCQKDGSWGSRDEPPRCEYKGEGTPMPLPKPTRRPTSSKYTVLPSGDPLSSQETTLPSTTATLNEKIKSKSKSDAIFSDDKNETMSQNENKLDLIAGSGSGNETAEDTDNSIPPIPAVASVMEKDRGWKVNILLPILCVILLVLFVVLVVIFICRRRKMRQDERLLGRHRPGSNIVSFDNSTLGEVQIKDQDADIKPVENDNRISRNSVLPQNISELAEDLYVTVPNASIQSAPSWYSGSDTISEA